MVFDHLLPVLQSIPKFLSIIIQSSILDMAHSMWPLIYLVDLAEILSVLSRPSHQLNRVYEGGDHMIQPDLTEAFIM